MRRNRKPGRWLRMAALLALLLLLVAVILVAGAGPAHRMGLLDLSAAFDMLRNGAMLALAAAGLALITLASAVWRRQVIAGFISVAVLAGVAGLLAIPALHWHQARDVPPIHDITTDVDDPPAFRALVDEREAAPNAVEHPGERVADLQQDAYPDIQPLILDASLDAVREAAIAEVLAFGWELAEAGDTRIEATATTTWFGFKDDVVIRLQETDDGIRVDVRSASRVGRSDLGTNAARIRDYLGALERGLESD